MTTRLRLLVFAAISGFCVIAAIVATARGVEESERPTTAGGDNQSAGALLRAGGDGEPIAVFRDLDRRHYGRLAVSTADSPAQRRLSRLTCDRSYFAGGSGICVSRGTGLLSAAKVELLDEQLAVRHTLELGGIPSRARISPDGRLASVTTFVTGHSYATPGQFSTATTLIDVERGRVITNLEKFTTIEDERRVTARDVNYWGVTFAEDGRTFYATMAHGNETHLIRGDVETRRAEVIHDNVECPSLSPDGTRIGFKKLIASSPGAAPTWRFTVLDLRTMEETLLAEKEPRDDQLEWLDDERLLYGNGEEIWTIRADGSGRPHRFAAASDSPAVIR